MCLAGKFSEFFSRPSADDEPLCLQALGAAEDESDIQAAKVARAEQKEELAEFDESIPWDEREVTAKRERDEQSKVEVELALLEKEVSRHISLGQYRQTDI